MYWYRSSSVVLVKQGMAIVSDELEQTDNLGITEVSLASHCVTALHCKYVAPFIGPGA